MRTILIVFALSLMATASCNNSTSSSVATASDTTKTQTKVASAPVQSKLNDEGTQLLVSVVGKYYDLKNALVATNADKSLSAASELGSAAHSLKASLEKDPTNSLALKPYLDTILSQCEISSSIKDESCEKQRLAFGALSSAMYGLVKNADLKNAHIYQEYCPMAFNDKGAHWLSDDSEIKNPYFGKKMLECGEVTDVIK